MLDITGNNEYSAHSIKIGCHTCRSTLCLPHSLIWDEQASFGSLNIAKRYMERRDVLYRPNDILSKFYVVRTGSYKASITNSNGANQIVDFFLPGEIIGLDALGGVPPISTVSALETSTICEIPEDEFSNICRTNHGLRESFLQGIANKIKQSNQQMMLIAQMTAEARLASFLINLSNRFKKRGFSGAEFNLSMSRLDIANYIGLSPASLSRVLASIQDKDYIKVQYNHIMIVDSEALCRLSSATRCSRSIS